MISIYDVAYEKCSMQSAKDKILSKMQPLKTNMKEIGNAPILTDNLCLRTAIRMILLQNKEIDSAYDNLELVNDNSGICTAISPSQKINTFDMLKLEYKYAHYGIGINTCDKRCKKPVDTLFQECSDYTAKLIKQLRIFQKCFGEIPTHECYFDGAYNDIVSKGYCGFPTYMLNDSIWIFNSMCLGDKWCLAVLLMAYVMGCHSRFPDYRKVTRLGIVNTSHGYIEILPVNQIPNLTFASVCTNYIGYNKTGNPSQWMNYCGTDNTRLESVLRHFKKNLPEDIINKYTASKSNSYPINVDKSSINPLMNPVNLFPSSLQCTSDVKPAYLVDEKQEEYDNSDSYIYIYYISDIHLEVKLSPEAFLDEHVLHNELCQKISSLFTKKFIQSISHRQKNNIVLFLGDIADTIHVSQLFYSMFIKKMKKYTSDTSLPIYAVLGNHEYSEFNTVEEGIAAYSKLFNELGINFANNDVFTTDIGNFDKTKIEIVCGTGFAKYNDIHNADNLEGPHLLNHISEAAESDALYAAHNSAIADPLTIEHPIIVASHYPIADWIPQNGTSSRCVYFNGHTHHNTKKETQQLLIYADNQIGLKRRRFSFKCAIIGDIYNPFADCTDGSYEITTDMYSQFFEYNHDYIRGTGTIDAQLADGTSQFIMIKQFGYYGFFIVDSAKGIKICMGGAIRKICCSADRKYIESNFGVMVANYLKILTPLRKFEEKASQEIKKIGLNGTIHGCIIDIDCFHHIMVNYIDHKITYYYSPSWGAVRNLNTFEETLDDICKLESSAINSQIVANYKKNLQEFPILSNHNQCMTHKDNVMQKVDIGRNGMYGASRKVKKLDRLFTDNVLCDWNERVLRPLS